MISKKNLKTPYYAVIFSSGKAEVNNENYSIMSDKMVELAETQKGFLDIENVKENEIGITISYWTDLNAIKNWKENSEHLIAQKYGKSDWYKFYKIRIAKVERDYEFENKL